MTKTYTVKQLNAYIRNMFASDFLLAKVSVTGEVSNFKDHPSGHLYFTLKDEDAAISVVMFSGNRLKGLKCRVKEGMKVTVTGQVSVYEAGGRYQLYARQIEDAGLGDLYLKYEELKKRLEEMGLFDAYYKKPIPKYAKTIGIVTSSSGAALQDILNIASRRNPYVKLILSPCLVQGDQAPASIVSALEKMDALHPDVIILGRGGGSMEDLWCFNDERVARAIFDCDTPVISAVGHEIDFTIADFTADLRAPTPSAAAELAVFDLEVALRDLAEKEQRLKLLLTGQTRERENRLKMLLLQLEKWHPRAQLNEKMMRLYTLQEDLDTVMLTKLNDRKIRLAILSERLNAGSPLKKLVNGYGYVEKDGKALKNASDAREKDHIRIVMHDGSIDAEVI